ncbi:MAG TPA: hypothetical protein VIJ12_00565 [Candidatus Baltobacteraceae bacterium]
MTTSSGPALDVITAPLAQIDRRSLSQAWYSALRLAREAEPAPSTPAKVATVAALPAARATRCGSGCASNASFLQTTRAAGAPPETRVREAAYERRHPPMALAGKIERALVRSQAPLRRATFTLDDRRGRVELLLSSRGAALHLIAICAPNARARVERALEQARFCLARRGIVLEARTRESVR